MPAEKSISFTGRSCDLFDFDFRTLTWSKATVTGDLLQPRASFFTTCHKGALVVMGGESLQNCHLCLNGHIVIAILWH